MEIVIKGEPKEIATLVVSIHGQLSKLSEYQPAFPWIQKVLDETPDLLKTQEQ